MSSFVLFAQPWWVNLLIFAPIIAWFNFRRGISTSKTQLALAGIFGIAFGYVEAAVVVYLRAATGLYPQGAYQPLLELSSAAKSLLAIEFFRNAATIVMILAVAMLAAKNLKPRVAMFLWVFAFWDIFYYFWLWVTIRWPNSLTSPDVLFLIPVPWIAQVWFPLLVSGLTILAIGLSSKGKQAG